VAVLRVDARVKRLSVRLRESEDSLSHLGGVHGQEGVRVGAAGSAGRVVQTGRRLLRFAFYGRVSTEDRQDPVTSQAWQQDRAEALIAGEGQVVERFFDEGFSRHLGWELRPAAARLLAAVRDPGRGFDAVVVGSYERAFYGNQASLVLPVLEAHGVQLWLPEVGGPVTAGHDELVALLGILSKREIVRARARTVGAMTTLVRDQGRYVGGRPAYGYRLVSRGPHPNRQHAAWGRKLLGLMPDPTTAPVVVWIFRQRAAGISIARIARGLNEAGCRVRRRRTRSVIRTGRGRVGRCRRCRRSSPIRSTRGGRCGVGRSPSSCSSTSSIPVWGCGRAWCATPRISG
jgi:DNA invertase Pin-like site-specific DNA recombinase